MKIYSKINLFIALVFFYMCSTSAAIPQSTGTEKIPTLAPILKNSTPAIVNISIIPKKREISNPLFDDPFFNKFFNDFNHFHKPFQQKESESYNKQQSIESGVIIDSNKGYIVTNYHVIKNAKEVFVTLKDKRQLKVKIVGTDSATDIALLKIDAKNIISLPISNSDNLEVGDYVIAIGHPFSLNHTVTSGIVSGLSRSGLGIEGYEDFIQTDASINPGNSGGALINLKGELIGINTFILSGTGGNIGIGFAIPSNIVQMVAENLIKYGEVKRGQIGIYTQNITTELAKAFDLSINKGAIISKVNKNSPAEKAGLMEGDVITKVDGKTINNISDVKNIIGMHTINEKVQIDFLRGNSTKTAKVLVAPQTNEIISSNSLKINLLEGASFSDITSTHPLFEKIQGILITSVKPGSPAWNAGLREKDIIVSANKQKITNIATFKKAVNSKKNGILLNVRRENAALYIIIH